MTITAYYTSEQTGRLSDRQTDASTSVVLLDFLDEGGANLVFRIFAAGRSLGLPNALRGRLLRLRKEATHAHTTKNQLQSLRQDFFPLFPECSIIEHELIRIERDLLQRISDDLQLLHRPSDRIQDTVSLQEVFGLLISDLTPDCGEVLVQLKPKWLAQSRDAPAGSRRCRTCAIRAKRISENASTIRDVQAICPLRILDRDPAIRRESIAGITGDAKIQDYLANECQALLTRLRSLQLDLDKSGLLKTKENVDLPNLCRAMTLRDCTLFLKRSGNLVEARLADLDSKMPEKFAKWQDVEQSLIAGGWYLNEESEQSWIEEAICLLASYNA